MRISSGLAGLGVSAAVDCGMPTASAPPTSKASRIKSRRSVIMILQRLLSGSTALYPNQDQEPGRRMASCGVPIGSALWHIVLPYRSAAHLELYREEARMKAQGLTQFRRRFTGDVI